MKYINRFNLNTLLFIIFFLSFMFRAVKKSKDENIVYINIYGTCKKRIAIKIDDDIIFDKKLKTTHLLEIRKGPFIIKEGEIRIHYYVDDKDTSFTFPLKKNNYLSVGYSDVKNEFQFMVTPDSAQFFNSRID